MNKFVQELKGSKLYKFSDWKTNDIPNVCAGVYAIYDSQDNFIYIGMAGAGLTEGKIKAKEAAKKKSGLRDRLGSHATGYRSGDRFNIYIGDLYVLGTLAKTDIDSISQGVDSFDTHIKSFITDNLSYRYVITNHHVVRRLETYIQKNGIDGELPKINAKP